MHRRHYEEDSELPDGALRDLQIFPLREDGTLVTNGGRVLGVTATAPRLTAAITQAYAAAEKISFEKLHKRTDIGMRALKAIAEQ